MMPNSAKRARSIRSKLCQRHQHKAPLGHARMGQSQVGIGVLRVAEAQDIKVYDAWTPAPFLITQSPQLPLYGL